MTIGETIADAPRPLFGTAEKAIPSVVAAALPRMMSHVNVNHLYGSVGRSTPKNATPAMRRSST